MRNPKNLSPFVSTEMHLEYFGMGDSLVNKTQEAIDIESTECLQGKIDDYSIDDLGSKKQSSYNRPTWKKTNSKWERK